MKNLLKHSRLIIIASVALTVALAIPLLSISIENTIRRYMSVNSESYKRLIATTIDPVLNSKQLILLYHKIRDVAEAEVRGHDLSARYYGDAVLSDNATQYMLTDLVLLIPLVVLIACGSAYGIHVMTHYYAFLEKVQGELTKKKHVEIICESLKDVWAAVLLAGITTVAGFISLVTSPMMPLKSFVVFTALRIVFSLLLSVTFIPAMLYLTPLNRVGKKIKFKKRIEVTPVQNSGKTLYGIYHFFTGTKSRLAIFSIAIIAFSAWGLSKLVIDTSLVNYFPADSKFRKDVDYVDENFAGTGTLYFVISGQEKGDMTKPEILRAVDNLQNYLLEKHHGIGKAVSFATFIKRMNQVMHVPILESESADEFDSSDFVSGDFAGDDWDDWGDASNEIENAAETKTWVDPNIEYAKKLKSQITVQQALRMFADAYTAAGGRYRRDSSWLCNHP